MYGKCFIANYKVRMEGINMDKIYWVRKGMIYNGN